VKNILDYLWQARRKLFQHSFSFSKKPTTILRFMSWEILWCGQERIKSKNLWNGSEYEREKGKLNGHERLARQH
jgi:hypothetical protein